MADDTATYFWHEDDGWRFNGVALIHGPFKTFGECISAWSKLH